MSAIKELKIVEDKRFTNKKFFGKDFSFMDLNNADFRSCTLCECNFEGSDLTKADFKGANLYGANLKDTIMHRTSFEDAILSRSIFDPKRIFGVTLTMTCDTFSQVKVGRNALLYWLYMPLLMKIPDEKLEAGLREALGPKVCEAMHKIFTEQVL